MSTMSEPPVIIERIRNKSPWYALIRYEILVILVWMGAELGRKCAMGKEWAADSDKTTEFSYETKDEKSNTQTTPSIASNKSTAAQLRRRIQLYVLYGALLATFLYWLLVDVWQPDMFHSLKVVSRPTPAEMGATTTEPNNEIATNPSFTFTPMSNTAFPSRPNLKNYPGNTQGYRFVAPTTQKKK